MRISDVLDESQINELNLGTANKSYQVGNVVGKGVRGIKQGWQNTKGALAAAKQGYNAGVAGIQGKNPYINAGVPPGQIDPTLNPNQPMGAGINPSTVPPTQNTPQTNIQSPAVKPPVARLPTINSPNVSGDVNSIKKAYGNLTPQERLELKHELEVIDDHDRIATGTNEHREEFYSKFLGKQL